MTTCRRCGKEYSQGVYGVLGDDGFTELKICMDCWKRQKEEREAEKE